jgi:hypothetical protein
MTTFLEDVVISTTTFLLSVIVIEFIKNWTLPSNLTVTISTGRFRRTNKQPGEERSTLLNAVPPYLFQHSD